MSRQTPLFMTKFTPNPRLACVCLLAVAVSLPVALISLSKLALLLAALMVMLFGKPAAGGTAVVDRSHLVKAVLLALALFAASLTWTTASMPQAMLALEKHGKLILIPLLVFLIRTPCEARLATLCLLLGQAFLLTSSWLLAAHITLPWAVARDPLNADVVFSTRLDQPIMTAVFGALCWHLRRQWRWKHAHALSVAGAAAALLNVLYVMDGGTAYLVAALLAAMALLWDTPAKWRLPAIALGFAAFCAVMLASDGARERFSTAAHELRDYSPQHRLVGRSSSGERLIFWRRSLQAMAERPVAGFGVGSWNQQFLRLDAGMSPVEQWAVRNPHQELLLWGVELGAMGVAAFLALLSALWRDAGTMNTAGSRALASAGMAMAASCMLNSSLFDALIGDYFCVTLGLLTAAGLHGGWQLPVTVGQHTPENR
jgi:O-antigen ligase